MEKVCYLLPFRRKQENKNKTNAGATWEAFCGVGLCDFNPPFSMHKENFFEDYFFFKV